MPTLEQFLAAAAAELTVNSPTPRVDTEVILMHVCRLTRAQLLTRTQQRLTPEQEQCAQALLLRRRQGEPVAYLTGEREFWSLAFVTTPAALIPRPETELLVEQALARIPRAADYRVADLGTGSGAIAVTLASARPRCHVLGTDISLKALRVARHNARRHAVTNIDFAAGDWCQPLPLQAFHLIVSNPPYVRDDDPHLNSGDVRFEPRQALRGGPDGLDAIRRIAADALRHLRAPGWLLLEHGHDQQPAVTDILQTHGYRDLAPYCDDAARPRVMVARAPL